MFSISTYEQVAAEPSTTAKGKLDDYFGSVWNKFDFVIYVTCLVTFVLKNFKETFWVRNLHEQTIDSLHSWLLHFKQLVVIVSQQNIGSISRIRSKQLAIAFYVVSCGCVTVDTDRAVGGANYWMFHTDTNKTFVCCILYSKLWLWQSLQRGCSRHH